MPDALPSGVVTLLFTDIEGSSALLEQAGAAYGGMLADHRRLLRAAFTEHGGVEVDTQGDAFFVAFATPADAVRAATDAHAALDAHPWPGDRPVRVRIGVHTGTPELGEEGYWGADVHYGARLAAAGHGGQTVVSATTAALLASGAQAPPLRSLGEHAFKDYTSPREIFEVASAPPGTFPPLRSLATSRSRLPQPTSSFIGRDQEVEELVRMLHGPAGVVTVVGPGGQGKTRLALETARVLTAAYDEVWFLPLEGVVNPDEIEPALTRLLGVGDTDAVSAVDLLADRSALVVLDNIEHLLEGAAYVARLAAAGPRLRVLVTSQAPLRVRGERVLRLAPLGLPEEGTDPTEAAGVRLFLDRAAAAGHPVDLGPSDLAAVTELVQRLEGMPLAIELAAPRLGLAGPAALCRQLDRSLDALGEGARDLPPRQRSLRATLDWTCSLLTPAQAELLAGLAAFSGDTDPELVDRAFPGAFTDLGALLDVGLLVRQPSGRLALRPAVRRYAEGLVDADTREAQHRAVCRALAELAEPYPRSWLVTGGEGHALLDPEEENVVGALDWARGHDPALHAELAGAVGWAATHRGVMRVVRSHVDHALRADAVSDPVVRARLLTSRGALGLVDSDPAYSLEAAHAWHELDDAMGEVVALLYASNLLQHAGGDDERTVELARRALDLALDRLAGETQVIVIARSFLAQALWSGGQRDEAVALQEQAMAAVDDDPWRTFFVATLSADFALEAGRSEEALLGYGRCMTMCRTMDMTSGQLIQAVTAARALLDLGRTVDGTRVWAVCEYVDRELGAPIGAFLHDHQAGLAPRLDAAELARARQRAPELGVSAGLLWAERLALGSGSASF